MPQALAEKIMRQVRTGPLGERSAEIKPDYVEGKLMGVCIRHETAMLEDELAQASAIAREVGVGFNVTGDRESVGQLPDLVLYFTMTENGCIDFPIEVHKAG